MRFCYDALPGRVVFGPGSLSQIGDELSRLGIGAPLLVAEPFGIDRLRSLLPNAAGSFTGVREHVPVEVAAAAVAAAASAGADGVVVLGGGSSTGTAKAIALETSLPILAVPTTYAGSEMTPIYGLSDAGEKKTGRDPRVQPRTVIYDPELFVSLPAAVSAASAMNALAHCVEALYAPGANPVIESIALRGARAIFDGLGAVLADPSDLDARADTVLGAYLAGVALAGAGVALHHQTCHVLGGAYGFPHAAINAAVLPYVMAYVAPAVPDVFRRLAHALDVENSVAAVADLVGTLPGPTSLRALGMSESDVEPAAAKVAAHVSEVPRPLDHEGALALIAGAYVGAWPFAGARA